YLERQVELHGVPRGEEFGTYVFPEGKPGDQAQCLDVRPSRELRTDEEEEQAYGLAVERIEVDGLGGRARRHPQLRDGRRLSVRDRDAVADPGREDRLALPHGAEHVVWIVDPVTPGDELDELPQDLVLLACDERDLDPLRRDQIRKKHGYTGRNSRRGIGAYTIW